MAVNIPSGGAVQAGCVSASGAAQAVGDVVQVCVAAELTGDQVFQIDTITVEALPGVGTCQYCSPLHPLLSQLASHNYLDRPVRLRQKV
jgi:hypothetical protein